jgi:hypothetical protein
MFHHSNLIPTSDYAVGTRPPGLNFKFNFGGLFFFLANKVRIGLVGASPDFMISVRFSSP